MHVYMRMHMHSMHMHMRMCVYMHICIHMHMRRVICGECLLDIPPLHRLLRQKGIDIIETSMQATQLKGTK